MAGWIPRSCPKCSSKKITKHETAGSVLGKVVDLGVGIATGGMYWLFHSNTEHWIYKCKKCGFEWEVEKKAIF